MPENKTLIINKICRKVDFFSPTDHSVKIKESRKRDKDLDLAKELRELWNMLVTVIPIAIGALGRVPKSSERGLEETENQWTNRDHLDYSIAKIGQNTQKSPGDLKS